MGHARAGTLIALIALIAACGHHQDLGADSGSGVHGPDAACTSLSCFQYNCAAKSQPPTSISGIVYAPNGTLPLYGVNVYVPASDPGPLPPGSTCDQCASGLPGGSLAATTTDAAGHFELDNVPATTSVPIVIQIGKWRRELSLPTVAACQDTPVDAADTTLPKSRTDMTPYTTSVNMPKIALSTGSADALECLLLKLGIAEKEITNAAGGGQINLFTDTSSGGVGASKFVANWPGGSGSAFANSQTTLWNAATSLAPYDIVLLSCEGGQYVGTKPQSAMTAMKAYADDGGRVFLSHWHNVWIEGNDATTPPNPAPAVWTSIATWNNSGTTFNSPPTGTDPPDLIDTVNNPKGPAFATWMVNVGATPTNMTDVVPIQQGKQTATGVDLTKAERWVYWNDTGANPAVIYPQNFQFTTPNEDPPAQRCGKVVFSDMHVSSGSTSSSGTPYPGGCSCMKVNGVTDPLCTEPNPMTPQEKALAFMFFDIASCVNAIE